MIIELKADVQVARPNGKFMIAKAGRKVNYSSKKRDDMWVHRFSIWDRETGTILEYICTSPNDNERPSWL